jgi:D-Tyr-tRNAtyr deacylase
VRVLVQRVARAEVRVARPRRRAASAAIARLLLLVGLTHRRADELAWMADKVLGMRIFATPKSA